MDFGEIYRLPNTSVNNSVERFHTIANKLKEYNGDVIIGTDQYFDLLKYNICKNTQEL